MSYLGRPVAPGRATSAAPADSSAETWQLTRPGGRVVIISASVGAGHDGAAAELTRRLSAAGAAVDRHDLMELLPAGLGPVVRGTYHRLLTHAPWIYERVHDSTDRAGGCGPATRALLRATRSRVLRVVPPDADAVVATYPGAARILGALRLDGRLRVPALTYLTDFSVHPLWVAPGVDVHLAAHEVPAGQARALGAAGVRVCGPVAGPTFRPAAPAERRAARERFALPPDARLALLVAGSWGVGPVRRVAAEIRDSGAAVPVVVCGRNEDLARRLRADGFRHVHGWVDDMAGLMHAADVLVQNAGGLTSLEAFAAGLPVASYRCIAGHGQTNAAALDRAGVAAWIRDAADIAPVLGDLVDGPRGLLQRTAGLALFAAGPDCGPAAEILRAGAAVPARVPAPRAPGTPPAPPPDEPRRRWRRLGVTSAVACTMWAGAVGTGIAATHHGAGVLRTIGHHLYLDRPQPAVSASKPAPAVPAVSAASARPRGVRP